MKSPRFWVLELDKAQHALIYHMGKFYNFLDYKQYLEEIYPKGFARFLRRA
ncbi:hypothetical protein GCM10008934_07860 [Virgibacillus salarius]